MRACYTLLPLAFLSLGAASLDAPRFVDVTAQAGIHFHHETGAFGAKYLPETMGAGVAFLDYDNDGWLDIFFVNGKAWPGHERHPTPPALYRNQRDGTFVDVTHEAGLAHELYGMGVAAADYDNDGWTDLYVTALGGNRLYHNRGNGSFEDVSARAGVAGHSFGTSAAFFDYDNDGRLDIFVANYVAWSIDTDRFCTLDGESKSYCTPESYRGESPTLYHNLGNGRFEDVTAKAGLADPNSKALGVALLDVDSDGWVDLVVANDTQPNRLYRNTGHGTFEDLGLDSGIAYGENGMARAGMGVDAGDYAGTGRPGIVIGNFSHESIGLYRNEGADHFVDDAAKEGLTEPSFLTLAFATFFWDYDLDGWLDIFAANGHVAEDVERVVPGLSYAQRPHLFHSEGGEHFEDVAARMGPDLARPVVGRGAAFGDYDNDGDPDLVITENGGPARLLRNDGGNRNHFLRVRLQGTHANRDGIGARVTLILPNGRRLIHLVRTGSSYCSQSDVTPTFGLGRMRQALRIEVAWPGGTVEKAGPVEADRVVLFREGEGLVWTRRLPGPGQPLVRR